MTCSAPTRDKEAETGGRVLVMTGDRDMFQCASERVKILYVRTGKAGRGAGRPDRGAARYGVPPELVPDFIALRGDPSDGIPGAKGIGEKTAADLLGGTARSTPRSTGPCASQRPGCAGRCSTSRDELLRFREIATLQAVDVELPPDGPTDLAGPPPRRASRG